MLKTLRSRNGFTLIELMIVVVIIGILAALAIPRFSAASDRAKEKEADGILKQVHTLQTAYHANKGSYATTFADLQEVGWQAPTDLQHYADLVDGDLPGATGGPLCMSKYPADASHNNRCIGIHSGIIANNSADVGS